jgi:hypothetical protein
MALTVTREDRSRSGGVTARVSAALWRRAWLRATLTLTPPLAWFLVIYLASLVVMLVTAFWTVNPFTNTLEHTWTLANFRQLFTGTYLTIIGRTLAMAAIVTVTDAVLALHLRRTEHAPAVDLRRHPARPEPPRGERRRRRRPAAHHRARYHCRPAHRRRRDHPRLSSEPPVVPCCHNACRIGQRP